MPVPALKHIPKLHLLFHFGPPKRSPFSFSLRSLFILTTLVAIGTVVAQQHLRNTGPERKRFENAKHSARRAAAAELTGIDWVTAAYGEGETILVMGYGYNTAGKRSQFRFQYGGRQSAHGLSDRVAAAAGRQANALKRDAAETKATCDAKLTDMRHRFREAARLFEDSAKRQAGLGTQYFLQSE